jgi:hypothetical protein
MRPVVPALLVAGLALAGCQHSEQDRVRDVVTTFIRAYADGDAKAACAQLVPEVRDAFEGGCETGIKREISKLGARDKARLRGLKIGTVSIEGDTARAHIEGPGGEPGTLRKVGGQWLIENR